MPPTVERSQLSLTQLTVPALQAHALQSPQQSGRARAPQRPTLDTQTSSTAALTGTRSLQRLNSSIRELAAPASPSSFNSSRSPSFQHHTSSLVPLTPPTHPSTPASLLRNAGASSQALSSLANLPAPLSASSSLQFTPSSLSRHLQAGASAGLSASLHARSSLPSPSSRPGSARLPTHLPPLAASLPRGDTSGASQGPGLGAGGIRVHAESTPQLKSPVSRTASRLGSRPNSAVARPGSSSMGRVAAGNLLQAAAGPLTPQTPPHPPWGVGQAGGASSSSSRPGSAALRRMSSNSQRPPHSPSTQPAQPVTLPSLHASQPQPHQTLSSDPAHSHGTSLHQHSYHQEQQQQRHTYLGMQDTGHPRALLCRHFAATAAAEVSDSSAAAAAAAGLASAASPVGDFAALTDHVQAGSARPGSSPSPLALIAAGVPAHASAYNTGPDTGLARQSDQQGAPGLLTLPLPPDLPPATKEGHAAQEVSSTAGGRSPPSTPPLPDRLRAVTSSPSSSTDSEQPHPCQPAPAGPSSPRPRLASLAVQPSQPQRPAAAAAAPGPEALASGTAPGAAGAKPTKLGRHENASWSDPAGTGRAQSSVSQAGPSQPAGAAAGAVSGVGGDPGLPPAAPSPGKAASTGRSSATNVCQDVVPGAVSDITLGFTLRATPEVTPGVTPSPSAVAALPQVAMTHLVVTAPAGRAPLQLSPSARRQLASQAAAALSPPPGPLASQPAAPVPSPLLDPSPAPFTPDTSGPAPDLHPSPSDPVPLASASAPTSPSSAPLGTSPLFVPESGREPVAGILAQTHQNSATASPSSPLSQSPVTASKPVTRAGPAPHPAAVDAADAGEGGEPGIARPSHLPYPTPPAAAILPDPLYRPSSDSHPNLHAHTSAMGDPPQHHIQPPQQQEQQQRQQQQLQRQPQSLLSRQQQAQAQQAQQQVVQQQAQQQQVAHNALMLSMQVQSLPDSPGNTLRQYHHQQGHPQYLPEQRSQNPSLQQAQGGLQWQGAPPWQQQLLWPDDLGLPPFSLTSPQLSYSAALHPAPQPHPHLPDPTSSASLPHFYPGHTPNTVDIYHPHPSLPPSHPYPAGPALPAPHAQLPSPGWHSSGSYNSHQVLLPGGFEPGFSAVPGQCPGVLSCMLLPGQVPRPASQHLAAELSRSRHQEASGALRSVPQITELHLMPHPRQQQQQQQGQAGGNGGSSLPGPGPATQLALHREEAEEQLVPRPGGLGCREVPFPCEEADESSSPYSSSDSGSLSNPTSPQSSRAPSASAISNTARAATVGYTAGRVADPDWCDTGEDRASDSGSDLTADLELPFPTYEYGSQQRTQRRASSSCDSASNYQLCYVNVAAASHLFENGNGPGSALYDYPDFRANAAAHDGSGSDAATTTDSYTYGGAYPTAGLGRERYDSGAEDADDCDEDAEDGEEEDAGQGSNIGLVHRSGDSGSGSPWHGSALQRLASTPAPLNYLDASSLPQAHGPGSGALLTRLRSLPEPLLPSSSSVSSLDLAPDPAAQPRSRGPRRMGVASSHPLPVSELHGSRGYEDGPGRGQGPASRQGLAGSGLSASRQEEYRLPFQQWMSQQAARLLLPHHMRGMADIFTANMQWQATAGQGGAGTGTAQLGGSYIDAAPQLPPSSSSFSAASRGLGQPGGLYWQHGGSSTQGMGQGLAAGGGAAGHGWWGGQPPLAPSGSGGMGGRGAATPMFGKHTNGRGGSNSRSNSPGQPDSPSSPSALHQGLREVPSVELFSGRYPSKTTRTLMADPGFVQQLLAGLPGVDPAHPAVAAVLAGLAGRSVLVGPLGPLPPPARPAMGGDGLGKESMAGMASGEG